MTDHPAADPPVVLQELSAADAVTAAADLADAERAVGGELVDEAERRRLDAFAAAGHERAPRWQPYVAVRDGATVAYAGLVLPATSGGDAVGDLALTPGLPDRAAVLGTVLALLSDTAAGAGAGHLQVWSRRVDEDDLAAAAEAGSPAERRLAVLGRRLPVTDTAAPAPPAGVTIRAFTDADEQEVVRVLAAAYAGTPDGGWDLAAFRTRRGWDWFRAEDLLVADRGDGRLLGLHWLKRRDTTTGEVHNLAVDPDGQGSGLGAALLRAGFDHLADVGCTEVVLWVDRANDRAVRLYTAHGMVTRWDDVAFGRRLAPATSP